MQTDLAIRSFRAERGRLPHDLNELVPNFLPAAPLDPFTHEQVVFRPSADGFTLYTAGRDRRDDGGQFTNAVTYNRDPGYDFDLDTLTPAVAERDWCFAMKCCVLKSNA